MKRILIALALIFTGIINTYATHLMGGEITYKHIANDDYEVTLIVYRDCSGVSVGTSQNVTFESATCGLNFSATLPLITTIDVSQVCPTATTTCNGGTIPGTEQWIYRDTVTMVPCTDWLIHWNSGNRNPSITNLVGPGTTNLFIMATLDNVVGALNNSPQYIALPTPYLCSGQLNIFNHGASDIDGDSLYYTLAQPLTTPGPPGTPIPYAGAYTINDPVTTAAGMNLTPTTGEMCFTPVGAQICVVSVVVSEYRNNVLIGTQIREMQVVVENNCTNQAPFAGSVSPSCGLTGGMNITTAGPSVTQLDSNSIIMCPDDSICFTILFTDPNGDNINVASNIATAIPTANFTITGNGTPNPVGVFCWVPTPLDSGINILTVSLQDDGCPISAAQYFTYDITVYDQPYAGPDQVICGSQTAQLQAQGGAGYIWSVITGDPIVLGTNFSCNNCDDPIADPSITTTYLLTSTLAAACSNTDTVTVFVVPDFTPDAIGDTALCDFLSHQLDVNITGPAGTYLFNWNNGSTLDNDTIQNPIASPTQSTWYVVEVESPDGCVKKVDSVQIIVTPPPSVTMVPGDTTICQGEGLNFDVSLAAIDDDFNSGFDPSIWATVSGASVGLPCVPYNGTALNFDAATRELTTNTINVTNCTTVDFCLWIANDASSGACENADLGEDVVLNYNTGSGWVTLQTFTTGDWDTGGPYANAWQCFSVTIPLAAQTGATQFQWAQIGSYGTTIDNWALDNISISCGGNSAYNYSWAPATDLSATNISNPVLSNASATTNYVVTITDTASGCAIDRDQTIFVVPNYTLSTTQSDTNICLGQTVSFTSSLNPVGSYNYTWSPSGIMDDDTIANPTGTFMTPGTNMVVVQVDNGGGCIKMDTMYVNVSYGFQPNITMTPDSAIICGLDSVQLDIDLGGGIPALCGPSPTTACSGASTQLTLGTSSGANSTTSWPAPYGNFYRNAKHQFLYTAAELNAMGFTGGKLTEIAWEITTVNGTTTYNDYQIKMGCTSTSNLTAWESGLTPVFGSPLATHNINIAAGWNTHVLDVAYEWDGVSNLVVEICYDNLAVTYTNNSITPWETTSFTSSLWYRSDSQAACPEATSTGSGSDRPITRFTSCPTTPDPFIYSYVWTPSTGLSDSTIKNPLATPSVPTTYYVTVTDTLGGCFDTDSVYISVGNDFTALATVDTSICIYNGIADSIQLLATPDSLNYIYDWNNGTTLTDSTISNPMAFPTTTTDYIVSITSPNGCERIDTATISVFNTNLPLLIQGTPTYCHGDSAMLYVGNYDTYNWHNTIDTSITISNVDTNYLFAGNYTVSVTANGCSATSDTITVSEITVAGPTLSDTSFCVGSSVNVDAGPGYTGYNWQPTGGNNQIGNFNTGGTYYVLVDSIGCTDTSNIITITEITIPVPTITGNTSYCGNDSTTLSVLNNYDSYLWTPTGSTFDSTLAGAGIITVTVDSNGCSGSASITITNPNPFTQITGLDSVCPGDSTFLSTTNGPFDSYLWTPTGSTNSTTTAPAGAISVVVTLDGCDFTANSNVYHYPTPNAYFTVNPALSGQPNMEIIFTDGSTGATSWNWDFDATNVGTAPSGGIGVGPFPWTYDNQGTYTITLTVANQYGCTDSYTHDYLIFTNIIMPNVITPNGDNMNDLLIFENLDPTVFSNHLTVFNRWGGKVFEMDDYDNTWDGGSSTDGTYFYVLEVDSQEPQVYNGNFTIIK